MIGLLSIGVALLLGIGMRIAAVTGAIMVVLMWSASLRPQDDIFMNNHIVYALVLLGIALGGAGNTLGLGKWWTGPLRSVASRGSAELGRLEPVERPLNLPVTDVTVTDIGDKGPWRLRHGTATLSLE